MKKKIKILIAAFVSFALSSLNAQDFEISPVDLKFNAEPGQVQSKAISITNHSNQASQFAVSLADFVVNKQGRKVAAQEATTEHSLANWISINPPVVELQPNETRQIIVSVQSPAKDYSSRWSYIFIKNVLEQTAFTADKELSQGLNIMGRIAVEVYQSAESNKNYAMQIYELHEIPSEKAGVRKFRATAYNSGEKITNCKVTLLASNMETTKETVVQVVNFQSFPETPREINFELKTNKLQNGKYALAAILDYGAQSNLEGTQIVVEIKN